ncbi:MAG: glycosyltransferase family 2 protein [Halioglobus sp.]|nr:glycosyltransferase family 2 protein [Halioglobus sp.]
MQKTAGQAARLSVSIVLYNSPISRFERTLNTLQRAAERVQEDIALQPVVVRVVDNASESTYRAELSQLMANWPKDGFLQVEFLPLDANIGFGAGHNAALDGIDSDYHLVLNPDVELDEDALAVGLTRLASDSSIALLSPRVTGSSGQPEYLCKRYPSVLVLLLRGFAPRFVRRWFRSRLDSYEMRDVCIGDAEAEVDIASGCFMLLRTDTLRAVHGFDEGFLLYFEDFDLCLRLRTHGRLLFYPDMRIVHHGGEAARKGLRHISWFVGSALRFFRLHGWKVL